MNFIEFDYPSDWDVEGWIKDSTMEVKDANTKT